MVHYSIYKLTGHLAWEAWKIGIVLLKQPSYQELLLLCLKDTFLLGTQLQIRRSRQVFFLLLHGNLFCGHSLEVPWAGFASTEYQKKLFLWRNKKKSINTLRLEKVPYLELWIDFYGMLPLLMLQVLSLRLCLLGTHKLPSKMTSAHFPECTLNGAVNAVVQTWWKQDYILFLFHLLSVNTRIKQNYVNITFFFSLEKKELFLCKTKAYIYTEFVLKTTVYFLFFWENKNWLFTWIICLDMKCQAVFSWENKRKYLVKHYLFKYFSDII